MCPDWPTFPLFARIRYSNAPRRLATHDFCHSGVRKSRQVGLNFDPGPGSGLKCYCVLLPVPDAGPAWVDGPCPGLGPKTDIILSNSLCSGMTTAVEPPPGVKSKMAKDSEPPCHLSRHAHRCAQCSQPPAPGADCRSPSQTSFARLQNLAPLQLNINKRLQPLSNPQMKGRGEKDQECYHRT